MKFTSDDLNSENTWQIGTGDDTMGYSDIFLKYGVALVGPGDPGREVEPNTIEYYKEFGGNNWGAALKSVKKGQWMIARKGKGVILAVGKVIDEYNYSSLFDDVAGWDLQHYVKVQWYTPKTEGGYLGLANYVLSQSTLQSCYVQEVYDSIYNTEFEECPATKNLEDVAIPGVLEISHINEALIDYGLRIQDADNICTTLQRVIRLADWYVSNDGGALESELVTFLVVPFLIALGWSEQKIKLEYSNTDVALFKKSFTSNYQQSPYIVLEAKKFNNGLAFTEGQLKSYSGKFPECQKFIATNGFRYYYFEKENERLSCKGSMNLRFLKERNALYDYPLDTIETILAISNF